MSAEFVNAHPRPHWRSTLCSSHPHPSSTSYVKDSSRTGHDSKLKIQGSLLYFIKDDTNEFGKSSPLSSLLWFSTRLEPQWNLTYWWGPKPITSASNQCSLRAGVRQYSKEYELQGPALLLTRKPWSNHLTYSMWSFFIHDMEVNGDTFGLGFLWNMNQMT